jgi:hypothetical protein
VCSTEGESIYKQLLKSMGHSYSVSQSQSSTSVDGNGNMNAMDNMLTCVDAFTRLFEFVASVIDTESSIVEAPSRFGTGSSVPLIRNLQAQTVRIKYHT